MPNGEKDEKSFAARIRSLIGDGEAVTAFARRVGMHQAAIDRYIKGLREPNADALRSIAISCKVSTDWLLGLTDNPNGEPDSIWRSRALEAEDKLRNVKEALPFAIKWFTQLQEAVT